MEDELDDNNLEAPNQLDIGTGIHEAKQREETEHDTDGQADAGDNRTDPLVQRLPHDEEQPQVERTQYEQLNTEDHLEAMTNNQSTG